MSHMIVQGVLDTCKPGDTLYNLGDISFGSPAETVALLKKIRDAGIKHILIEGNHDKSLSRECLDIFDSVHQKMNLKIDKKRIAVLCHFPVDSWENAHYGSYMFHGHRHSAHQPIDNRRRMDVGIDTRPAGDMKPWNLDELMNILKHCAHGEHHD